MSVMERFVVELEGSGIRVCGEHADTGVALLQLGFAAEAPAKVLSRRPVAT